MNDLIAAFLSAQAMNVGLSPVTSATVALTRERLAHVDQHYLRPENYAVANAAAATTGPPSTKPTDPPAAAGAASRPRDRGCGPGLLRGR